jgi:hypothetical protein
MILNFPTYKNCADSKESRDIALKSKNREKEG